MVLASHQLNVATKEDQPTEGVPQGKYDIFIFALKVVTPYGSVISNDFTIFLPLCSIIIFQIRGVLCLHLGGIW